MSLRTEVTGTSRMRQLLAFRELVSGEVLGQSTSLGTAATRLLPLSLTCVIQLCRLEQTSLICQSMLTWKDRLADGKAVTLSDGLIKGDHGFAVLGTFESFESSNRPHLDNVGALSSVEGPIFIVLLCGWL